jgi:hypothetical protein
VVAYPDVAVDSDHVGAPITQLPTNATFRCARLDAYCFDS